MTVKAKKVKDEKEDNTTPVALKALDDEANGGTSNEAGENMFSSSGVAEPTCKY